MLVFLALILVPLTEIALFILLGGEIGVTSTLIIVLATALIGSLTLRTQGLQTLRKLQTLSVDQEAPVVLVEGLLIAAAGLLLLTPGFLTDTIGFLLLVPPIRSALARRAAAKAFVYVASNLRGRAAAGPDQPHPSDSGAAGAGDGRPQRPERPFRRGPTPHVGPRKSVEDATIIEDDDPKNS